MERARIYIIIAHGCGGGGGVGVVSLKIKTIRTDKCVLPPFYNI
jgi:hypothetical protein